MKTWTQLLTTYEDQTDNSTANTTRGTEYLNDSIRAIASIRNGRWKWLETVETIAGGTVASQSEYDIPNNIRKVTDIYITVGTTVYMPTIIFDPIAWKKVLSSELGESDVPRFIYIQDKQMFIEPTPATSANTISVRGRLNLSDLGLADYTTGTISALANAATTITGSGTTFTADMVGRYIQIAQTTATGGGDGFWYKIASYTSATEIDIDRAYQGTTLSGASATYTIGQSIPIPEAYQRAVLYRSEALYWEFKGNYKKSDLLWRRYDGGVEAGLSGTYGGFIGQMLEESGETVEGAYMEPSYVYGRFDPNNPEPVVGSGSFI